MPNCFIFKNYLFFGCAKVFVAGVGAFSSCSGGAVLRWGAQLLPEVVSGEGAQALGVQASAVTRSTGSVDRGALAQSPTACGNSLHQNSTRVYHWQVDS